MKCMKMKTAGIILMISVLISVLVGCGSADKTSGNNSGSGSVKNESGGAAETKKASPLDSLVKADFNGGTFAVYGSNTLNGMDYVTVHQFNTGAETGEPVNDELYRRDRYIENLYNVKIKNIVINGNPSADTIIKSALAGDSEYDMLYADSASVGASLYLNKVIVDMYTVPHISFNTEYWQKSAQDALTLNGKYYFATGYISPRFFGSIYILSFNKAIHNNYKLPDFYDIVLDKKWTIDVFMENCRNVSSDLNGDGVMDKNDLYGLGYEVLTPEALYIGCGYNITTNTNKELKFTLDDPGAVSLIQKIKSFFWEKNVCFYYLQNNVKIDTNIMFSEGKTLFNNPCTFDLEQLRQMKDDYGILPMPKLDEKQEDYYSYGQPWANSFVYIPITNTELDRAGTIIEAMAVYGSEYLKPAIYDNVLKIKGTRDEESAKVIDLMMSNIRYDLTPMFTFGNIYNTFKNSMLTETGNIASLYAASKQGGEAAIRDILKIAG